MLSYNILNDFVEKLKSGNVTPDDLVKVGNTVKNADLQVKYEVEDIKAIPSDILNEVKCGDVIAKKTGEQYHSYIVTYKQENQGICLTYFDASVVETQSYDYVTDAWVYNSEDKTNILNYTAGDNVTITNGVISATDTTYTAGTNITITDGVISASGGDIWESEIVATIANEGEYYCRLYTKEELTSQNVQNIVYAEASTGLLPLYLRRDQVGSGILTHFYISSGIFYFKGMQITDGALVQHSSSSGNAPQWSVYYSHKIN